MLTDKEIAALMKSVAAVMRDHVAQSLVPLQNRMAEFDARLAAIPAIPTPPADEPPAEDKAFREFMTLIQKGLATV